MSTRPSEPLVKMLREVSQRKGLNTAALARAAGLDRTRLKHLLAGSEAITVDEFLALANALEITPSELGLSTGEAPDEFDDVEPRPIPLRAVSRRQAPPPPSLDADPLGNHAEQIFRVGFALGVDMFFLADSKLLGECGVPRTVLARYPENLPIRLDAAYHRHNDPQFLPEGLQLVLSFDSLTTCLFPWAAFRQVTYYPLPPEPAPEAPEPGPGSRKPKGRSHLRLVE